MIVVRSGLGERAPYTPSPPWRRDAQNASATSGASPPTNRAACRHVAILAASVLIGGLYSIFHSTMQVWATDISPEARGTAAALFVTAAFLGGAIGTGLGAFFAQGNQYRALFVVAALLSVPVVITAALTRARYPGTVLAEQAAEVAAS